MTRAHTPAGPSSLLPPDQQVTEVAALGRSLPRPTATTSPSHLHLDFHPAPPHCSSCHQIFAQQFCSPHAPPGACWAPCRSAGQVQPHTYVNEPPTAAHKHWPWCSSNTGQHLCGTAFRRGAAAGEEGSLGGSRLRTPIPSCSHISPTHVTLVWRACVPQVTLLWPPPCPPQAAPGEGSRCPKGHACLSMPWVLTCCTVPACVLGIQRGQASLPSCSPALPSPPSLCPVPSTQTQLYCDRDSSARPW